MLQKYMCCILLLIVQLASRAQGNPAHIPRLMAELAQSRQADTARLSLYLKIASSYIAPGRTPNLLDSAAHYLGKARELNAVFKVPVFDNRLRFFTARLHLIVNNSDDPRSIYLPVIEACRKTGDARTEAMAWLFLGMLVEEDPDSYDDKLHYLQNGLLVVGKNGDEYVTTRLRIEMARVHILQNKFSVALQELKEVLQRTPGGQHRLIMHTYFNLAFLYFAKGQSDTALDYSLKTQQVMGLSGDSTSAYKFFQQMTLLYKVLGRDAERHAWAKIQLEYGLACINHRGVYSSIIVLTTLLREERSPAEALQFLDLKVAEQKPVGIRDQRLVQQAYGDIYNDLKQYERAEKHYLEMIRLGHLQTRRFSISEKGLQYYKMGQFYFKRGSYNKALDYLNNSLENYKTYSLVPERRLVHQALYRTDSALGNQLGAIQHLKEYYRIGDSIFRADRARQVEELDMAYKTAQKDKSIQVLQAKEEYAQLQLRHTKSMHGWIVAAATLAVIIAALLYRQSRVDKRNNHIVLAKNSQLEHLVAEKDWLVKEIHHRVKNNLQTVTGLLGTQSGYLKNPEAITAIDDSRRRIQSMSLIHQRLYQSNNLSTVKLPEYLYELVDNLRNGFNDQERVHFILYIAPLELDLAHCIPLGLIVNEAITNAFKHAFPGQRQGSIQVELIAAAGNYITLTIQDDGIGLPPGFDPDRLDSMGIHLMRGLSKELGGRLTISGREGCQVRVSFPRESSMV